MEVVPPRLEVDPGHLGSVKVHLTNPGPEACEVVVQVPRGERDWTWVHPASCAIAAGADAEVAVFFKPSCGPRPSAGTHEVSELRVEGAFSNRASGRRRHVIQGRFSV